MSAPSTDAPDTMYRRLPPPDWTAFLPANLRPYVQVPAWATDCHAEGWTDPQTGAWVGDDAEGTMSFYFSHRVPRLIPALACHHGEVQDVTVLLWEVHHLTRTGEVGLRAVNYRREPFKVLIRLGDADDIELPLNSALLLLETLGEAVTPVAPATRAALNAERAAGRRHGR